MEPEKQQFRIDTELNCQPAEQKSTEMTTQPPPLETKFYLFHRTTTSLNILQVLPQKQLFRNCFQLCAVSYQRKNQQKQLLLFCSINFVDRTLEVNLSLPTDY